jgi:hypothetical protein
MWQKRTGTLHLLHSKTWFLAKLNYIRETCKSLPRTNILAAGESVEKKVFKTLTPGVIFAKL